MILNKLVLIFRVVKIKLRIKHLSSPDFDKIKLNIILCEFHYILTIET